jgi:hypothetical protein
VLGARPFPDAYRDRFVAARRVRWLRFAAVRFDAVRFVAVRFAVARFVAFFDAGR